MGSKGSSQEGDFCFCDLLEPMLPNVNDSRWTRSGFRTSALLPRIMGVFMFELQVSRYGRIVVLLHFYGG